MGPYETLIAGATSYLIGAIPVGFLIVKAIRATDIRKVGSGNIGATNVARVLGRKWFFIVFLLDVLKGFLPCLFAGMMANHAWRDPAPLAVVLCGLLAVVGHNWPVYLRFRGGKGVATSCGVCLYLFPVALLGGIVVWGIVAWIWRYVSLASISCALAVAALVWVFNRDRLEDARYLLGFVTLAALMIVVRHHGNIARLIKGTEAKIGQRAPSSPAAPDLQSKPGTQDSERTDV